MFTKIFHKTKAMPRITKIDSKITNWTNLSPRFVTVALKNHKIIRKDLISISLIVLIRNLIFHKHSLNEKFLSLRFIIHFPLYFTHPLSLSLPLPIMDTIMKLTLLFEGWSRAWSPRMREWWAWLGHRTPGS